MAHAHLFLVLFIDIAPEMTVPAASKGNSSDGRHVELPAAPVGDAVDVTVAACDITAEGPDVAAMVVDVSVDGTEVAVAAIMAVGRAVAVAVGAAVVAVADVKYQLQVVLSFVRSTLCRVCVPTPGTVQTISPVFTPSSGIVISIS